MTHLLLALALWVASAGADVGADSAPSTAPVTAAPVSQNTAITASLVLSVDDRAAALDEAIALARSQGGWFAELSTTRVALRVPVAEARGTVESLRGLGDLVQRNFGSADLSPEVVDLESRLKARREVLARYESVLSEASPKSVVSVERQITRVVAEIEQLEGRLRVLADRSAFARIDVSLRFRERRAPSRDGSSSFAWLNTLNVSEVLRDFEYGHRSTPSHAAVPVPDGFAPWRKTRRFQAVSPDEVVVRVRSAKNKPRADLDYWREAMRKRMQDAGYTELSYTDISASGTPGALLELGAANGEQDQVYLVGVFVSGRHLVLVEASGESTRFQKRRDAVVAAIEGMEVR